MILSSTLNNMSEMNCRYSMSQEEMVGHMDFTTWQVWHLLLIYVSGSKSELPVKNVAYNTSFYGH